MLTPVSIIRNGSVKEVFRNLCRAKNVPAVGQVLRAALINVWMEVMGVLTR